jgi:hypothetical protein
LPAEAQEVSTDDLQRILDKVAAEVGARTVAVEPPSANAQPVIAVEPREIFGTGRVEIAVGRPGEQARPLKLSESSKHESASFDTAAAPSTPTLPVGGGREELFRAPHVMVLVQLAESRSVLEDVIAQAGRQLAPDYREIAESEVKRGFWRHENARRAADYRLRGPSW